MGAEYLSYVKSIATFAPTFYGYIISVLRRGHVAYFSCLSLCLSLCHSAFAMFILKLWTELEGKHCKSTMTKTKTKTKTKTGKISNKISP